MQNFIFQLVGGLGFFFFGMKTLSEGLKKSAGEKLKSFLHSVTKQPIIGILVGAFVTALVQSSSATTVMVVGFINAALLTLRQGISVIMGANIGTTVTAWLVSSMSVFKITTYSLPAVGVGFGFMVLAKTKKWKSFGQVVLGFGLLFIGLEYMKNAFEPLRESEHIKTMFVYFSRNPWLGAIIGMIVTCIIQSSSATIAIVQVLAYNGVITFDAALPLIIGSNIGTTITAQLAAIGTNINARRSAMSHTIFNVFGALYMLLFITTPLFHTIINNFVYPQLSTTTIMFYIAISHTIFNIANTIVFLPFILILEKASIFLVPKKADVIDYGTKYLERHLLDTPGLALEQVNNEIVYMLSVSKKAVTHAVRSFLDNDLKRADRAIELETITDNLQSEITQYIIELSQRNLLIEESKEVPVLIHSVNDIERIGDHAQALAELAKRKMEEKMPFSDYAIKEIEQMWEQLDNMFEQAMYSLKNNDIKTAQALLTREGRINTLEESFKQSHIKRLNDGKCTLNSGFIFLEFIDNLEKIADRLTNTGQSVIGRMQWSFIKKPGTPQNLGSDIQEGLAK